jgi:hypothetical protein
MLNWKSIDDKFPPEKKGILLFIKKGDYFNIVSGHREFDKFGHFNLSSNQFEEIKLPWRVTHWASIRLPKAKS